MNQLLQMLQSGAQGASNAAASTVSAPVDGLAWLLRKAGLPIPQAPLGGSDWMAQQGLTAQPTNRLAGLIGEGLGAALPGVVAAKAPQIAGALLKGADNLAAPSALNKQAGVIKKPDVVFKSVSDSPEKWALKQGLDYSGFEEILNKDGLRILHKNVDDQGFGDVVAMKNGRVVGTTFYGPHGTNQSSKTLEAAVEVDPAFRRQGIATSMYDAIEKLKNNRFAPADSNTPLAQAFWENRRGK